MTTWGYGPHLAYDAQMSARGITTTIEPATARRMAVRAALLADPALPPTVDSVARIVGHFGGIQIDPTRTVERTQHLVLWSRIAGFERGLLDQLLADRRLFEYNAFIVGPERVPELLYVAHCWPRGEGSWVKRARTFIAENAYFRQSILDQLRAAGPLQSREIDDSKVKVGWTSTGWTHAKNTSQMLEFMSVRMEVAVAGRVGQERLWDLAERVIPASAPTAELTTDEYEERRVMRALERFGVATLREIRLRAYGLAIPAAKALVGQLVEAGRLTPVNLHLDGTDTPAYALPAALAAANTPATRTTLLSPFDPLVYDRERTERLFGFRYKLEMYVPKGKRQFDHFVLPILHHDRLVGRLDSERDRKTNELVVKRLHWESPKVDAEVKTAVDRAIGQLAEFVRSG
jgi:uncharacterized protein YcaQ